MTERLCACGICGESFMVNERTAQGRRKRYINGHQSRGIKRPYMVGDNNPSRRPDVLEKLRKPKTEEHKLKLHKPRSAPMTEEHKRNLRESIRIASLRPEVMKKRSDAMKRRVGPLANNWKGGIATEPYSRDWTKTLKEAIRQRDGYTCRNCGIKQDMLPKSLDVHHVDYDKTNCNPDNLVSLCHSCHMITQGGREQWKLRFRLAVNQ